MKSNRLFLFALTPLFVIGACSRSEAPVAEFPEAPRETPPRQATQVPAEPPMTQLLTNEIEEYRLLYPAEYNVVVYQDAICLTLSDESFGTCHTANAFVEASDAGGRDVNQIADEVAGMSIPDIEVKRTSLTISGEEAVLLDDVHTYDVLRKVVIVHNERAYILTFAPWFDAGEEFARMQNLYSTVIDSFRFYEPDLNQASGPAPDAATGFVPPSLTDISTMTTRSLASTSPDDQWTAEALLAFFTGETDGYKYTRLTLTRDFEGRPEWIPYQEWSESGIGESLLSDFYWSGDGRYVYFTQGGIGHPCGGVFVTNLRQVDLTDGSLSEVPLTDGLGLGPIAISPDVGSLAFRVPAGFSVRDLTTGDSRLIPYEWPADNDYQVGSYAWSPAGDQLAFTVSLSSCVPPAESELHGSSIRILDFESGEVRTLTDRDPRNLAVTSWPDPAALRVFSGGKAALLQIDSGVLLPDPLPVAEAVLTDYLNSLAFGGTGLGHFTYGRAADIFGGGYQTLIEINPEIDPADRAALLRSACEINGYQCLRLRQVVSSSLRLGSEGAFEIQLTVELKDSYGSRFSRGPCCGDEAAGPPQSQFIFTVRRLADGSFQVLELPPYVP